jgi:hypothetical protein
MNLPSSMIRMQLIFTIRYILVIKRGLSEDWGVEVGMETINEGFRV